MSPGPLATSLRPWPFLKGPQDPSGLFPENGRGFGRLGYRKSCLFLKRAWNTFFVVLRASTTAAKRASG
jgi:hypothetical protein